MATYLPGVEPFIPDYQPFQPDLNFYNNVLQTKQNQYDTNWKHLNEIYGQYFYADVVRPEDIEKKDKLLKKIDFELRRVSGLDLSLQQNLDQATQVFRPFYEDKVLMHDMAYTKNFKNKRASALNLKSGNEKEQEMYWDTGIEYMDIMKDRYANSTAEESLTMWAPEYTPYVNASKHYRELAEEMGIEADITTPNGKWMVRQRNGDLIYEPLVNIFKSEYANSPGLQDVYRIQAFVNGERSIRQKVQEGMDRSAATSEYISAQNATIQAYLKEMSNSANKDVKTKEGQLAEVNKNIKAGKEDVFTNKYKSNVEESVQYAKSVWANVLKTKGQADTNPQSTVVTSQGNITASMQQMLDKVNAGTAMMLANQDIYNSAYNYSRKDMLVDYKANPFEVIKARSAARKAEIDYKDKLDRQAARIERGLANNYFIEDYNTGEIRINDKYTETKQIDPKTYTSEEITNIIADNEAAAVRTFREDGVPAIALIGDYLARLAEQGLLTDATFKSLYNKPMTEKEADDILYALSEQELNRLHAGQFGGFSREVLSAYETINPVFNSKDITADKVREMFTEEMINTMFFDQESIRNLYDNTMSLAIANRGDAGATQDFLNGLSNTDIDGYIAFGKRYEAVKEMNNKVLKKSMMSSEAFGALDILQNSELKKAASESFILDNGARMDKADWVKLNTQMIGDAIKEGLPTESIITMADQSLKVKGDRKRVYTYVDGKGGGNNLSQEDFNNIEKVYKKEADKRLKLKGITINPENQLITIRRAGRKGSKMVGVNAAFLNSGRSEDAAVIKEYERTVREIKDDIAKEYVKKVNRLVAFNEDPSASLNIVYDDLAKIYAETAQNSRELKAFTPNIFDKGNRYAVTGVMGMSVPLAVASAEGTVLFTDVAKKLNDMDFSTSGNITRGYRVGLGVPMTKTGLETAGSMENLGVDGQKAQVILEALYRLVGVGAKGNSEKPKGMDISVGALGDMAFETPGAAAIVIADIDYEWLYDNFVKSTAETEKGLLTSDEAREIALNGIAFTAPYKELKDLKVMETAVLDPYERILVSGGTVEYYDPYNAGGYTIKENPAVGQPHIVQGEFQYLGDDGEWYQKKLDVPTQRYNLVELDKSLKRLIYDQRIRNNVKAKQLQAKGIELSTPPELR